MRKNTQLINEVFYTGDVSSIIQALEEAIELLKQQDGEPPKRIYLDLQIDVEVLE